MKQNIIIWAIAILISSTVWVVADLTSHTETLLDNLLLAIDSDADGVISDETWHLAATGADVTLDTTDFDGRLSVADDSVQKAMDTLDDSFTELGTTLSEDNSSVVLDDDGVDPGTVTITLDGSVVAAFAAAGNSMGPLAITKNLTSNNTYSSIEVLAGINGGETIDQWEMVYYDSTQTEWMLADASTASNAKRAWGIAVAGTSNGAAAYVMTRGYVRYDTWNWTPLDVIYTSDTTAGGLLATAPDTSGDTVQPVGIAVTADIVYFNVDFINGYYTVD